MLEREMESVTVFGTRMFRNELWLPHGFTWNDIREEGAKFESLCWAIPLAFFIIVLRKVVENYVFRPFGRHLGIKNFRKGASEMSKLDLQLESTSQTLKISSKPRTEEIAILAKKLDIDLRVVERWVRRKLMKSRPTKLDKFAETGWRYLFYSSSVIYGIFLLNGKKWFWDISYCFEDYPRHWLTNDLFLYYLVGTSFYLSLAVSQFFDIKRVDFWQMFIHHMATLTLLTFSFATNLARFGSIVLFVHDVSDVFLELAKLAKYAKRQTVCNVLFGLFTVTWIVTRLGIIPFYILKHALAVPPTLVAVYPLMMMKGMLVVLQILHVFWSLLIFKALYKTILNKGNIEKDERSSSEEEEEEEEEEESEVKENGDIK